MGSTEALSPLTLGEAGACVSSEEGSSSSSSPPPRSSLSAQSSFSSSAPREESSLKLAVLEQTLLNESKDKTLAASLGLSLLEEKVALVSQIGELQEVLGAAESDNERLRERLRRLDHCFYEEEAENSGREEQFASEIHALRAQLSRLSKELERARSEAELASLSLEESRELAERLAGELAASKTQLRTAAAKRQRMARDKAFLQQRNTAIKAELSQVKTRLELAEQLRREVRRLRKENLSLLRLNHSPSVGNVRGTPSGSAQSLPAEEAEEALVVLLPPPSQSTPDGPIHGGVRCRIARRFGARSRNPSAESPVPRSSASTLASVIQRDREEMADLREQLEELRSELAMARQDEALAHCLRSQSLAAELREVGDSVLSQDEPSEVRAVDEDERWTALDAALFPLKLLWHLISCFFAFVLPSSPPSATLEEETAFLKKLD